MERQSRIMGQALALFAALATVLALAWWANGQAAVSSRSVPCAAEDACDLDYRDGAWHIGTNGTGANSK